MKDRIKEVRKYFKQTQAEFAERLNLSKSAIEAYEYGRVKEVPERLIKDICREFGVSYEWLTEGTGDMLVPKDRATEIAEMAKRIMDGESEQIREAFVNVLTNMNEAQILALYDVAKATVNEVEKNHPD